jgi:hypothetical protein
MTGFYLLFVLYNRTVIASGSVAIQTKYILFLLIFYRLAGGAFLSLIAGKETKGASSL